MEMVFASNNEHKLEEVSQALSGVQIRSLREALGDVDIVEDGHTLDENAAIKARYVHERTGLNCFADDTGLEIKALNGKPGVYSARYAGNSCSFDDNMNKVLLDLEGVEDRSACFRTVIHMVLYGQEYSVEGRVDGEILPQKVGAKGFGYDPIFRPSGSDLTFAEMSMEEKNRISHRGQAVQKLSELLDQLLDQAKASSIKPPKN